jgi:hypothetical protein
MKRFMQLRYLVLFFITVSGTITAETFSQKTFFNPRAVGANRAMEYTTWQEFAYRQVTPPSKSRIFSHVALTPFYQASQKSDQLGQYFGIGNGKNSFTIGSADNVTAGTSDIINSYLIHDQSAPDNNIIAGGISFNPKQEIYGIRLDYFQEVNSPFKHFFIKASLPIVHVQNDMGMKIKDSVAWVSDIINDNTSYSMSDFFKGLVTIQGRNVNSIVNKQQPLTKAKIDGRRTATGLADLNLAFGYKLHQSEHNQLLCNVGVLIPTGTKTRGEYLFEPRCGNGGHTGFTAGIDGAVTLWTSAEKDASVRLLGALDYRYLFEANEVRTLSLNDSFFPSGTPNKLNFYYIGTEIGSLYGYPAANIFTRGLAVKPGSQGEALVDLSFKCSGFVIDLGYNAFYKEKESVWLKNWDAKNFIMVTRASPLSVLANTISQKKGGQAANILNASDIAISDFNLDAVSNPSQFSHKIFGGFGYSFALAHCYVAQIGLGASYEFASDNSTMEAAALWAKAGISF